MIDEGKEGDSIIVIDATRSIMRYDDIIDCASLYTIRHYVGQYMLLCRV